MNDDSFVIDSSLWRVLSSELLRHKAHARLPPDAGDASRSASRG